MGRFFAGVFAAIALMGSGLFIWRAQADQPSPIPARPVSASVAGASVADYAPPPAASEQTREEKRFARYDKDRNGKVGRGEYLISRQKAFARIDTDGDGRLSFDEYAVKAAVKFAGADRDRDGALTAPEFATTRVVRKSKPRPDCPQVPMRQDAEES